MKQQRQKLVVSEWHHLNATDAVLGRLATTIATLLIGKHQLQWQRHAVAPIYVVVTNTDRVALTGKKEQQKMYRRHTGYPGGLREETAGRLRQRDSRRLIRLAVEGMLPKNSLRAKRLDHLKLYRGADHPHAAQLKKL